MSSSTATFPLSFSVPVIHLTPLFLAMVLFGVATVCAVMSAILHYHWKKYSYAPTRTARWVRVYYAGIVLLLGVAGLAAIIFSLSYDQV